MNSLKIMLLDRKKLLVFPIHEKWDDVGRQKDLKKHNN